LCSLSIFRLDFPAGEIAVFIPRSGWPTNPPAAWSGAGADGVVDRWRAGGEVWGRLDEAAARELRRRV